jgi:hypothetical protein
MRQLGFEKLDDEHFYHIFFHMPGEKNTVRINHVGDEKWCRLKDIYFIF